MKFVIVNLIIHLIFLSYYAFSTLNTSNTPFRFLNEFLRGDNRGSFIPGLTPSQFWAIIMVVMGILFMFIMPYIIKKLNIDFDYNPENEEVVEELNN